jgi:hypothetical protein
MSLDLIHRAVAKLPVAARPLWQGSRSKWFCCQKQARIQAAHDAAFDVWLHAKSWRTARRAAQKLNATALQFGSHTCEQATNTASDGAEPAGSQASDDSQAKPHNAPKSSSTP